jgi:subtilisin family serine protease
MSDVIHRIPPYVLGPKVYFAHQIVDRQPWSMVTHHVPDLFAKTKGKGITVAVLDTGLWRHNDLPDPVFAANFTNSSSVFDRQGHGTHVAGTIGARLDGKGVVGWAPEVSMGCCKVLGDDGSGSDNGIAKGIYYAAEHGAQIINMSLGGGFSSKIAQACKDVIQQGVFVICAAGNEGEEGPDTVGYPAKLEETLAIASYRKDGQISAFSSRGPEVDIAFPGEEILSTWINNTFREISGTSMATPAACGLTALMLAAHRDFGNGFSVKNNRELREHWKSTSQDVGDPGFDNSFGWGIPRAADVIGVPATHQPLPPPGDTPGLGFDLLGLRVEAHAHAEKKGLFIYPK